MSEVDLKYYRASDDVLAVELSLWTMSTIAFLGQFETEDVINIQPTTIKNCVNMEGTISLKGFIRVTFCGGEGAIDDGAHKLRVKIASYKENPISNGCICDNYRRN